MKLSAQAEGVGDVRLTQLDGKLPNLALMRLSAWHRVRVTVSVLPAPAPSSEGATDE